MIEIAKSVGKQLELSWKRSIPDNIFYYRPPDAAGSFGGNTNLRFSAKSPCDCFMFNGEVLYTLELKSVGTKSISFERNKVDKGIIHKHQIDTLVNFSKYKNVVSGFLLDFRLSEKTYFVMIEDFVYMINNLTKKSFNESDLFEWCNPIEIVKKKMRTNWKYDIVQFFNDTRL